MADPVFGSSDRVDGSQGFPADLQALLANKPAADHPQIIATFYTNRENQLLQEARRRIAASSGGTPPPPNNPPNPPNKQTGVLTKEAVWNDPVKVLEDLKNGMMSKEDFLAATASAQNTVIMMAEQLASAGKQYWAKYRNEILGIMNNLPVDQRTDVQYWNTAYNAVIGNHVDDIRTEAVRVATTIAEPGQAPGEEPEPPADLSTIRSGAKTALDVCAGLSITPDAYRKGMKEMYSSPLGFTTSNVGGK